MNIKNIYDLTIKLGMESDLRGIQFVREKLRKEKARFEAMKEEEKKYYDRERLKNPYSDSRVFAPSLEKKIKRVMVGIDIDTSEMLVAYEYSKKKKIDMVISHHPVGPALLGLSEVVDMQAELISIQYGVPISIAQNLINVRVSELTRSISPINHYKVIDAARHLGIPLLAVHTPSDNMVASFLYKKVAHIKPFETVGDIMKILRSIPEYQEAMKMQSGPVLFTGRESNYVGKIALTEVTGGTSGSKHMYERLAQAGIGTIIGMHMTEEYKSEAEKNHINVIIAGHMSSDSLGMNLVMDELEKRGIEIVPCSGFIRISRHKKR